ncbi:MAG: hypothetical protein NTV76_13115 [Pseudomonas sp.]|nr:hypothetical protein [Pseudomonas sp.]
MYRRLLLIALLGLSISACVPYYEDGGSSYYRSEVYTQPAPAYYYGGGSYYRDRDRYYSPSPRYYQPAPRYYQPAPRYYQSAPRSEDRSDSNRGWDSHDRHGDNRQGDNRQRDNRHGDNRQGDNRHGDEHRNVREDHRDNSRDRDWRR